MKRPMVFLATWAVALGITAAGVNAQPVANPNEAPPSGVSAAMMTEALRAVIAARRSGRKAAEATALEHYGDLHAQQGDTFAALTHYLDAYRLWDELDKPADGLRLAQKLTTTQATILQAVQLRHDTCAADEKQVMDGLLGKAHADYASMLLLAKRATDAIPHLQRAIALYSPQVQANAAFQIALARTWQILAMCLKAADRFSEARSGFVQASEQYRQLAVRDDAHHDAYVLEQADLLRNAAWIDQELGQLPEALKKAADALQLVTTQRAESLRCRYLVTHASILYAMGHLDEAMVENKQALGLSDPKIDNESHILCLSNIGTIYASWKEYGSAIQHLEHAVALLDAHADPTTKVRLFVNLGNAYDEAGYPDNGLEKLKEAHQLYKGKKLSDSFILAGLLNNLAFAEKHLILYDEAEAHWQEALHIIAAAGRPRTRAIEGPIYDNLALLAFQRGKTGQAIGIIQKAMASKSFAPELEAVLEGNLGLFHQVSGDLGQAVTYFTRATNSLERLRQTVPAEGRSTFFATYLGAYRRLAACQVLRGAVSDAFATNERARSRQLLEQLAASPAGDVPQAFDAKSLQRSLGSTEAVVTLTPVQQRTKEDPESLLVMALTQSGKPTAVVVPAKTFPGGLARAVQRFRRLLQEAAPTAEQRDERERLARTFGDSILGPCRPLLRGKDSLIVVADDYLGGLPVEALKPAAGPLVINSYAVTHCPSLSVRRLLEKRRYPEGRQPLLALGGAIYDSTCYLESVEKAGAFADAGLRTYAARCRDVTASDVAASEAPVVPSRTGTVRNLPFTLKELDGIVTAFGGSEAHLEPARVGATVVGPFGQVWVGASANKDALQALQSSGDLANYRMIHFAAHGVVDHRHADQAALILSYPPQAKTDEERFLRASEIDRMDLHSDFVCLSACDSGMGAEIRGEGIVGLAHAFIRAGTKGLALSLWAIPDEGTSRFMVALYEQLAHRSDYAKAFHDVKRAMARTHPQEPYLWAPYVYYGL